MHERVLCSRHLIHTSRQRRDAYSVCTHRHTHTHTCPFVLVGVVASQRDTAHIMRRRRHCISYLSQTPHAYYTSFCPRARACVVASPVACVCVCGWVWINIFTRDPAQAHLHITPSQSQVFTQFSGVYDVPESVEVTGVVLSLRHDALQSPVFERLLNTDRAGACGEA